MKIYKGIFKDQREVIRFKKEPVEQEKLQRILETIHLILYGRQLKYWRFLVLNKPKAKSMLISGIPKDTPGLQEMMDAPTVLAACADSRESGIKGKGYSLAHAKIVLEALSFAALGLGMKVSAIPWFDENALREAFSIPDWMRVVWVSSLGYLEQGSVQCECRELSEIVFFETWGCRQKEIGH